MGLGGVVGFLSVFFLEFRGIGVLCMLRGGGCRFLIYGDGCFVRMFGFEGSFSNISIFCDFGVSF